MEPSPTEETLVEPSPTEESLTAEAVGTRPVYIAPRTKSKSLRGSIVIKADSIKAIRSPSEEEKQHFPKLFLNNLCKGSSVRGIGGDGGGGGSVGGGGSRGGGGGGGGGGETKATDGEAKTKDSPHRGMLTTVQEAVQRVRMGGDGADFVVVEWRQSATVGAKGQEQLEIKEVTNRAAI